MRPKKEVEAEKLLQLIFQIQFELYHLLSQFMKKNGLKPEHYFLLKNLYKSKVPLSIADITKGMSNKRDISRMVANLNKKELIKQQNKLAKRGSKKYFKLSEKGKAIYKGARSKERFVLYAFYNLNSDLLKELFKNLTGVRRRLHELKSGKINNVITELENYHPDELTLRDKNGQRIIQIMK